MEEPIWEGKSPSQTRNDCSREISSLLEIFTGISKELGLEFTGDKGNKDEVSIGGGGRMPKFFLGYYSEIQGLPSRIKIEINFVDRTIDPFHQRKLTSYMEDLNSENIQFLFKNPYHEYTQPITIECYDPREIYIEKCRASMTRIVYKLRDTIDIHMLQKRYGYSMLEHKQKIMNKTRFMIDLYQKYKENIEKITPLPPEDRENKELKLLTIYTPKDLQYNIQSIQQ